MIYVTVAFLYLTGMVSFWFLANNLAPNFKQHSKVRIVAVFAMWPIVIVAMTIGPLFMRD
jgi:cell division protein FtsX